MRVRCRHLSGGFISGCSRTTETLNPKPLGRLEQALDGFRGFGLRASEELNTEDIPKGSFKGSFKGY